LQVRVIVLLIRRGRVGQVSVVIKYRNPRRPGEAGMVLIRDQSLARETKQGLESRGFVIVENVEDYPGFPSDPR
jgi:hypothetical protein